MKKVFKDMLSNEVSISLPPKKIVSVVPSQTELLYDLGLDQEVIGITKFCVHPREWFINKTRVGGTKRLHLEKIRSLQPDLIIANKEENEKEQIEILAKEFTVWISDVKTIEDGLSMIREVGTITDRAEAANTIVDRIEKAFAGMPATHSRRIAYFIWYKPWMSVGGDTFISDVIQKMGWQNIFRGYSRYPAISPEELKASNPDLVLLSSEPFPFKEKHADEIKKLLPNAAVKFVDGEMFSWYGSRMQKAVPYFSELLKA